MNLTCNATLDDMRIEDGSEAAIVGDLTFHQLALIIAGATTIFSILLSFYLMFMHAIHYTKPREQKHIIRILFMVPVYAASSFLQIRFYYHAVYYQVISDCYEAFAISSFFALLCHYLAPTLHEQKEFFRQLEPVKPWVLPVNWFKACCGGERGPWRTPKSGLTWFNIIWIGIYHYCFIRVAMTITAVVSQYFGRFCESSNSPVFAHIWTTAIDAVAVTIAMYCIIQFYVQLKEGLAEHKPFLKVVAIKLVIFLSFWQSIVISVATSSTIHVVHVTPHIAYPDIKVGIPALLLCCEMALFSIMHLWAFPYKPYRRNAKTVFYPSPSANSTLPPRENEHGPPQGGFLGFKAMWDAINVWDVVKAFGRGMRWLFVGVKHRHEDISYQTTNKNSAFDMDELNSSPQKSQGMGGRMDVDTAYPGHRFGDNSAAVKSTDHLPIATEFRRSRFNDLSQGDDVGAGRDPRADGGVPRQSEERAGLIAHAQPNPSDRRHEEAMYMDQQQQQQYYGAGGQEEGVAYYGAPGRAEYDAAGAPRNPRNSRQVAVGEALWGHPRDGQQPPR